MVTPICFHSEVETTGTDQLGLPNVSVHRPQNSPLANAIRQLKLPYSLGTLTGNLEAMKNESCGKRKQIVLGTLD